MKATVFALGELYLYKPYYLDHQHYLPGWNRAQKGFCAWVVGYAACLIRLELCVGFRIQFDKPNEVVHVIYFGKVSLSERMQAVGDVCATYRHLVPLRILINVRDLVMHLSFGEQEFFGKYLASHKGLASAKVAVLHEKDHNPNVIVDTSAFVDGYCIAQFNDSGDAESWLAGA